MKPRKVYWEKTGTKWNLITICIYFYPSKGIGTYFSISGKPHKFGLVNLNKAHVEQFDVLPAHIQYALLHQGKSRISVSKDVVTENSSLLSLIEASTDFELITEPQVEAYKKLQRATPKTLEEVKSYKKEIEYLKKSIGIPLSFCTKVSRLAKASSGKPREVLNLGEFKFVSVLHSLGIDF